MHQGYDLKYLQLLSKQYPTIDEVTTEVINLSAIINLPKERSISHGHSWGT